MSKTPPRISVLVLTKNRLDVLRNCVKSILRQEHREFELVVLDDASDAQDTAAAIADEFADPRIRPYHVQCSLGVAGGRNFLMEQAEGDFIVSIDDDAVFIGDKEFDKVCHAFERDPATGIVAFRITNVLPDHRTPLVPFCQASVTRNPSIVHEPAYVSSFRGGGHAIRKCLIDSHGGYRRDMVFGEEEMDLAYRVIQAGHQIVYEPSIEVEHFPMPSVVGGTQNHCSSELYYHVRNRAYLAYRYLPWRYVFPYLGIWTARYAVESLRTRRMSDFIRGMFASPRFLRGVKREVLDRQALTYLTKHGGRLWY